MSVVWKSFLSKIGLYLKDSTRELQFQLTRNPKYLHLENVTQKVDEESPPLYEWTQLKQDLLAGAFGVQNPGFMVTNNGKYIIDHVDLLSTGPITIHKMDRFYRDWNYGFFVFKEKWSRTELEDIVSGHYWSGDSVWMLPNIDKMLSEEEARELWAIVDVLSLREPFIDCDLLNIKENGLEAIGCFEDSGNSILWTNPSTPENLDLVVKNLKKLCLDLKVKLKEI